MKAEKIETHVSGAEKSHSYVRGRTASVGSGAHQLANQSWLCLLLLTRKMNNINDIHKYED